MLATLQLLIGLGLGRNAVLADLVLTGATGLAATVVVVRASRRPPPEVVREAEAVLLAADERQPV